MNGGRLLFVDDEEAMREAAGQWLRLGGFDVETASDADEAAALIAQRRFDAVISDVKMPRRDGFDLLDRIADRDPDMPVILLTGHGNVPMAVEAMRRGAFDFLEKPYDPENLVALAQRAVEKRGLALELRRLGSPGQPTGGLDVRIIGKSPATILLRRDVERLAALDCDVIVTGETGSGKEVVARALHDFSRRSRARFVPVNCAAIPQEIFESELFGHESGAFTGASGVRVGKFEYANGGTLLLDEIESMPLLAQVKVLRVLQERTVERLGSNRHIECDVRIVAATKEDLAAASRAGRFRSDLYFRLNVAEIRIAPLRERKEDVLLLFTHFAARAAERNAFDPPRIPAGIEATLQSHGWPGNVRELKAVAERFALGLPADLLRGLETGFEANAKTLAERVAAYEKMLIADAIMEADGDMARVCAMLGLPRRTLNEKW